MCLIKYLTVLWKKGAAAKCAAPIPRLFVSWLGQQSRVCPCSYPSGSYSAEGSTEWCGCVLRLCGPVLTGRR
jgi:hypothetical protein